MKSLKIIHEQVKPSITNIVWALIQERIRNPLNRKRIASYLKFFRPCDDVTCCTASLTELNRDGVSFYPQFVSRQEITEIRLELEKYNCFDPWNREIGEFPNSQPPIGTHVGQIRLAPTLESLHKLALDSRIIDLVTAYFGCKPYLDTIQAWWSFPGNQHPQEAENFHRDNDSIRFLKFFIYASDVEMDCGPHVLVIGTHIEAQLLERRRFSDQEVIKAFGKERVKVITGKAGDAFIEDTFGIHKGQLPEAHNRLLIQFRYSTTKSSFRSPIIVTPSTHYQHKKITSLINQF